MHEREIPVSEYAIRPVSEYAIRPVSEYAGMFSLASLATLREKEKTIKDHFAQRREERKEQPVGAAG
ncbi:MAG: hypothetical protein NTY46_13820 [Candidatus Sumerlaeota bacterium]|nr:hypothetical protein [Candidatus Sumerlaeota bacterium]